MAEIAVNIVIDKLVPILVQETKLLREVHKEVTYIKDELESIGAFLRDADGKAETNEGVKTWVKQVREVAYRMEDVIDEYILHSATNVSNEAFLRDAHRLGFIAFLQKVVCFTKNLKWRHQIAAGEIQDIKTTISEVRARSERYGFNSIEGGSSSAVKSVAWDDPRIASLYIEEADLVGIVGLKQQLVACITKEESSRIVISLVGMGGVGKTTIAKKVYDSEEVTRYSDCKAWITVSQSYKMEEILKATMKQLYPAGKEEYALLERIDQMEGVVELIDELRKYLLWKRYFIVFDDVWAVDFWTTITHALPTNEKGCRIFITTRSRDVASSCVESRTHTFDVQPLPPDNAWELFCKKAFGSRCPEELEEVSRAIVKKCQGLPLAIVVIGGLLSKKKKNASEWQKFHDSLGSELENNPHLTGIKRILLLSYNDLLYCLKPCFLYFALFPEDYSISCGRLIRLWIAEGFVKETKGKTLEDVAGDYLNELVQRSLVQISSVKFDGRPRIFQVHDLIREILLSKYEELNFCCVLAEKNDLNFDRTVRRLSMHNYEETISGRTNLSKVRSILLFGGDNFPEQLIDYRLLKILDLENTGVRDVPESIGNLFHLKYFSLRNTRVRRLPKSIGKLHNLETLDLKYTNVRELPIEITRLHKLRHLLLGQFGFYKPEVKMPEGIGSLESLQTLNFVEVGHGDRLVKELKRLRQLRKLGITGLERGNGATLCSAIENMNHLFSLSVESSYNGWTPLDMQSTFSPPLSLQRLHLKGLLEKLPDWISKLRNLTRICLDGSKLLDDPLNVLQNLPNLLELRLNEAYDGELLYFKGNGFQKLKVLNLRWMDKLSMVMIDQGALPRLETLNVGCCKQLKEVPSGIQCLTRLRTLHFWGMPDTFALRMQPDGGPDHWKVKDIPTIMLNDKPFRMTKSDPQSVLLPLS